MVLKDNNSLIRINDKINKVVTAYRVKSLLYIFFMYEGLALFFLNKI
jgi:hypothetical protein